MGGHTESEGLARSNIDCMYNNVYGNITLPTTVDPHCDDYIIKRLRNDEYDWGNMRQYPSGVSLPIDA